MADRLEAGPYKTVPVDGAAAPFYLIPFDKDGVCEGPATRAALVGDAGREGYTDVFLFSHGWNNDWATATGRYDDFLRGYAGLRQQHGLSYGRDYRPLFVGIIWPSTALVMPWEEGPQFAGAGAGPAAEDARVAQERDEVRTLVEAVPAGDRPRFYELAQKAGSLNRNEAVELAGLLSPAFAAATDELHGADPAPP